MLVKKRAVRFYTLKFQVSRDKKNSHQEAQAAVSILGSNASNATLALAPGEPQQ